MWTRAIRVVTAGFVLAGAVVAVGVVEADVSNPGDNGRLVYAEAVEVEPWVWVSEIYTMNADGTDVRRLTFDAGQEPKVYTGDYWLTDNYSPVWSPRGDMIAYVHHGVENEFSIRLMDPDGNLLSTVTDSFRVFSSAEFSSVLSWSPDGEQLAFLGSTTEPGRNALWVIGIDGDNARLLVEEGVSTREDWPVNFGNLAWSPDGDLIAFSAFDTVSRKKVVHVIEPDGSGLRRVECGLGWADEPEWSPDGDALYCSSEGSGTIWKTGMPDASSYGGVVLFEGDKAQPTVSPDGKEFLFVSEAAGYAGIWTLEPLTRLADFNGAHLDWQPLHGLFWDDEKSVFNADIEWMAAEGITRGCNPPLNDKYCPDSAVTRGQMAAFLVRALDLTNDGGGNIFTDDDDSVFEADIERLATAGITKGCNPPANDRLLSGLERHERTDGSVPGSGAGVHRSG